MKMIGFWLSVLLFVCGCTPGDVHKKPVSKQREVKDHADAEVKARNQIKSLFIVKYEGKEWRLDLSQTGFDGIDPTTLDRDAFWRWFSQVEKEIDRQPKSAHFRGRQLVPHQNGRKVDRAEVNHWLDGIHHYLNRPLTVPVQIWSPPIMTETLKRIKEKHLASYSTVYNPHNANRAHNILLSARAIDHQVVNVGEVFSFNRTVGIRSSARGYRPAPVIVRGEYTEGVGGGICQTSSTLFNSVERAGLRVVQRVSHSKRVTYVPAGRDATVSWGGPDFQFQNQLNRPILIQATARYGRLTVNIYGSSAIRHHPKSTREAPKTMPETEKVPAPSKKRPLDEDVKKFQREPLPPDRISRNPEPTDAGGRVE